MQIISGKSDFKLHRASAVAIGKFDGIHSGHRLLIKDLLDKAKESGLDSVIFTFFPSPESFFSGRALPELTTVSEKREMFEKLGVDILIEFPINQRTAATDPEVFIRQYLCEQMKAQYIVAGTDVSYGDKGRGDARLLMNLSKKCGYEYKLFDKVTYDGSEISSTRIREAVANADMELATALLGSPYQISGIVAHGRHLGTTLGMPTANVYIPPDKLIGPRGVYLTRILIDGIWYAAVSNIGVKPTVTDDNLMCIETYICNFDGDIYGKKVDVELLKFCRPEMKFSSVDELRKQMERDIASGYEYHGIEKNK